MNLILIITPPSGPCWLGKAAKPAAEFGRLLHDASGPLEVRGNWSGDTPTIDAALTIACATLARAGHEQDAGWWACTPREAVRACEAGLAMARGELDHEALAGAGDTITALIDKIGVPPSIIARACGVHLTSVKRWQRGELHPDWLALARLRLLAQALGVELNIDDILGRIREADVVDLPEPKRKARGRGV